MALQRTFDNLLLELQKVSDSVQMLRLALGDKPPDESALADSLEYQTLEISGALEECRTAAQHSRRAVHPVLRFDSARTELTAVQSHFEQVSRQYAEMAAYDRLRELERLAGNRRREWRPWVASVLRAIEACRPALEKAGSALARCWQELAEHASTALGAVGEQRKVKRTKRS